MASPIFISNPPPGFSLIAILRGVQLGFLGIYRSWQQKYYRVAFNDFKWSLFAYIMVNAPLMFIYLTLKFFSLFLISPETVNTITSYVSYYQYSILNIGPLSLLSFSYVTSKLDKRFYDSLKFCDQVYKEKHPDTDKDYYTPLSKVTEVPEILGRGNPYRWISKLANTLRKRQEGNNRGLEDYLAKVIVETVRAACIYILSKTPYIGSFVVPIISFQQLHSVIGTPYAILVFIITSMIGEEKGFLFLNTIFGSKALMAALLRPYLKKLPFSAEQKTHWYRSRIGIIYGFGTLFYLLLRIPLCGVVVLGLAETSTAHLITKITEPPPPLTGSVSDLKRLSDWLDAECTFNPLYYKEVISSIQTATGALESANIIPGTFQNKLD